MENITASSPKEHHIIKCNGVSPGHVDDEHMYSMPSDYLSHIVVLGKYSNMI